MASPRSALICVTSRSMRASSCFSSCLRSASGSFGPFVVGRPPGPLRPEAPLPPRSPRLAPGLTTGFATMAVSAAARTLEVAGALAPGAGSAGFDLSFGAASAWTTAQRSAATQAAFLVSEVRERAREPKAIDDTRPRASAKVER